MDKGMGCQLRFEGLGMKWIPERLEIEKSWTRGDDSIEVKRKKNRMDYHLPHSPPAIPISHPPSPIPHPPSPISHPPSPISHLPPPIPSPISHLPSPIPHPPSHISTPPLPPLPPFPPRLPPRKPQYLPTIDPNSQKRKTHPAHHHHSSFPEKDPHPPTSPVKKSLDTSALSLFFSIN